MQMCGCGTPLPTIDGEGRPSVGDHHQCYECECIWQWDGERWVDITWKIHDLREQDWGRM